MIHASDSEVALLADPNIRWRPASMRCPSECTTGQLAQGDASAGRERGEVEPRTSRPSLSREKSSERAGFPVLGVSVTPTSCAVFLADGCGLILMASCTM